MDYPDFRSFLIRDEAALHKKIAIQVLIFLLSLSLKKFDPGI